MKKMICLMLCLAAAAGLAGCSDNSLSGSDSDSSLSAVVPTDGASSSNGGDKASGSANSALEAYEQITPTVGNTGAENCEKIVLEGSTARSDSQGVSIDGSDITITSGGVYAVSGTLTDGKITVDCGKENVTLILNGADITCSDSAAIYVKKCKALTLTLADGSQNKLESKSFAENADNIDGAIFSKSDVIMSGGGLLAIHSTGGHTVVCKDSLTIESGTYIVVSDSHGFSANDLIDIKGGSFTVLSGKDGFHAENTDDPTMGSISVGGGVFDICSVGDCFDSGCDLTIAGGTFDICTEGSDESSSSKGFKAAGGLSVSDGVFRVKTAEDSFHSSGDMTVSGGSLTISSRDDAFHSDGRLDICGGTVDITESHEGLEASVINISGGDISIVSDDDGINAAGGNDGSGFEGGFDGDRFDQSPSGSALNISGGSLKINAEGDGIDSNGALTVSGGEVYISGPVRSANGSLDYQISGSITGGIFVAADGGMMSENFSEADQGAILLSVGSQTAGTQITVCDSDGEVLISYSPEKDYKSVMVSCPQLEVGESYTVSAGSFSQEIKLDTAVCGTGSFGGGRPGDIGEPGGGMGGFRPSDDKRH